MEKNLILFDIGGVLLELDYESFYLEVEYRFGIDVKYFSPRYSELELEALKGLLTSQEYLEGLKKILDTNISEAELVELTDISWKKQINGTVNLKKKLYEAGYSVGLFSNISRIAVERLSKRFPNIFKTFDQKSPKIYSFIEGDVKPNSRMYDTVSGYDQVILIEDKEAYLSKAQEYGWKGIFYSEFIDTHEAIRSFKGHVAMDLSGFETAENLIGLYDALRRLQIKI